MQAVIIGYLKAVPAYLAAAPLYLQATWQTVQYFYEPLLAGAVAAICAVCLLLRVFLGGIGGAAVRTAGYGGLMYVIAGNEQFRLLYASPVVAHIIAALLVGALWLPVTLVGGIIRSRRRTHATAGLPAQPATAGTPFNVTRPDADTKRVMVIMMTDIAGYSAKMERDEAATYALLKEHNTIMRTAITTHRGKEIKTVGDAFMVVFENPLDALRCAIAMQNALHQFNAARPSNDQLKIRVGIHRGEVIATGKDVFGEGVNIAARLESVSEPGGICISVDVYDHVKNKVEAGFQNIGTPKMKNIANPPEVFRVQLAHQ